MSGPDVTRPFGDAVPETETGGGQPRQRRGNARRGRGRGKARDKSREKSRDRSRDSGRAGAAATRQRRPAAQQETPALDDAARELSESFQGAVLRHTTAAVLARGRGYAKRNRVSQLRISAGKVRARVLGSAAERYHVELTVPERPAPAVVRKIRWSCDCPYAAEHRRGTCKHVVAVVLVAGPRLARDESTRRRWLGQPASNAAEAEPAEFDVLADRLAAAFTAEPVSVGDVLGRALSIAPPPFDVPAR